MLLVVVCASHSTNLTVASVARGRIAQSALENEAVAAGGGQSAADARDRAQSESAVHRQACGMIVRYNKYLVNDYYSEFRANLRGWAGALQIQAPAGRRAEAAERASALQRLYTERVLPNAALAVLNNGVTYREHCVPAPAAAECARDAAAYKRQLVERLVGCLQPRLLNVSEHPTETRFFFTFRQHMEAALLLVLLGVSSELLTLVAVRPREENAARLRKVRRWFLRADTAQYLRRTVLCMRLTGALHDMSASTVREAGKPPMVVRFAEGEARRVIDQELQAILRDVHLDADLDGAACLSGLVGTAADLLLRFRRWELWPFLAFRLVQRFNPHFRRACYDFLKVPEEDLDVGFLVRFPIGVERRTRTRPIPGNLRVPGSAGISRDSSACAPRWETRGSAFPFSGRRGRRVRITRPCAGCSPTGFRRRCAPPRRVACRRLSPRSAP